MNDINYILNLDVSDFIELYVKTLEEKQKEKLFLEWVIQVPYMDQNSYTPFSEYWESCIQRNKDEIKDEDIIQELEGLEGVVKQFKGR